MRTNSLPGADKVEQRLTDLAAHLESVASLLVSIGAPRLRTLGHYVPTPIVDAALRLYALLTGSQGDDAHSQFNALVRRVVSYVAKDGRCVFSAKQGLVQTAHHRSSIVRPATRGNGPSATER